MVQSIGYLIDVKKVSDTFRRIILCNILIEYGTPRKLVELIKMHLNETYSKICIGKNLSDKFNIQNGLKGEEALLPLF
jgi:hypothetical protein